MSLNESVTKGAALGGAISPSGNTVGTVENTFKVNGAISRPITTQGYSAYEIALIHGFKGTEEEWLASLKGEKGDSVGGSTARIGNVTIFADRWIGENSPYSQVVEVSDVTENSQVDLTPSVEQLAIFHQKDLAFVTENDGGVVTVYAIGDKPTADYTIQVTITEVVV